MSSGFRDGEIGTDQKEKCRDRICCMETGKNDKILAIIIGAAGLAVLAVTVFGVLLWGPLEPVLRNTRTLLMMAEVVLVFFWNLFCLAGGRGKKPGTGSHRGVRALGLAAGIVLFTWCHRIFLPLAVSGIYMAVLILAGRQLLRLFLEERQLSAPIPFLQRTSMCLVLGSALWMVLVCLVSLTGHGGLMLWRGLAAVMALTAVVLEILWGRRNKQVLPGAWLKAVKNSADKGRSESMAQAALLAFIITMVLIQAGRMNIELDYDSLHYGLRSAYVLDNGKGIYENLGMINLVYTYSKGLEVLVLPLSGTPTYGFVLAFSLWCTVGILLLAADIVGRYCGQVKGILAAAILAAIPGIMNMAATAKSDNITLLHQLIIYDFICFALWDGEQGKKSSSAKNIPWLSMAVSTYLLTLVYKPTALVFSTALGGVALVCLFLTRRLRVGDRRGFCLLLIPGAAAAGLWYRTWLLTGVPVTSIFAGFFEKAGCRVKYPYTFNHVIGDPSALTAGEKCSRLWSRVWGILFAPVTEDMAHVIIAWGTGIVTVFLVIWLAVSWKAGRRGLRHPLNLFDCILIPVLALGSLASIYTLYQVDGNYFILFYAVLVISALRMGWRQNWGPAVRRSLSLVLVLFFAVNTAVTCTTGWAGVPGFTPVSLRHMGYYDHRREMLDRRAGEGSLTLSCMFTPRSRVLAFGRHPRVLDLPCSVQSYYDVTGSGGNVYLVKRLAYFEEFLRYAGTEYFFVEAGYLAGQDRALQMIEDMIAEGSLSDIHYEWGNMTARVTLDAGPPDDSQQALEEFRENYSMTELD